MHPGNATTKAPHTASAPAPRGGAGGAAGAMMLPPQLRGRHAPSHCPSRAGGAPPSPLADAVPASFPVAGATSRRRTSKAWGSATAGEAALQQRAQ